MEVPAAEYSIIFVSMKRTMDPDRNQIIAGKGANMSLTPHICSGNE
jgi:hypothetical protein